MRVGTRLRLVERLSEVNGLLPTLCEPPCLGAIVALLTAALRSSLTEQTDATAGNGSHILSGAGLAGEDEDKCGDPPAVVGDLQLDGVLRTIGVILDRLSEAVRRLVAVEDVLVDAEEVTAPNPSDTTTLRLRGEFSALVQLLCSVFRSDSVGKAALLPASVALVQLLLGCGTNASDGGRPHAVQCARELSIAPFSAVAAALLGSELCVDPGWRDACVIEVLPCC